MSAEGSSRSREDPSRRLASQRHATLAIAVACLSAGGYLALHHHDQNRVRTASELGAQSRYDEALAEARNVTRAPGERRALVIRAQAAQALGRHRAAIRLFSRAAERDPRNWSLHRDWAISLLALGDREAARRRLDLAGALNPRMPAPPGF